MKYWENVDNKDDIERGMFIILPLKYDESVDLQKLEFDCARPVSFESSDFVELLSIKCKAGDFVRRYKLNIELGKINIGAGIDITEAQLFVFQNHIAFLTVYLSYTNKNVNDVYYFVYPGYVNDEKEIKNTQEAFLKVIEEKILKALKPKMRFFITNEEAKEYVIKEAYRLNVAYMPKRFKKIEDVNKITYNEHRIIELSREFEDLSEQDVAYVTGAKDVISEDYGWGCSITSQEISYAYTKGKSTLIERAVEDLLLTILVMHQKYTCIMLNEEIHQRYLLNNDSVMLRKNIREIRKEALEFIAYGTLAPSQISRWNNVCDTYRFLMEKNGVNEALEEIKEKIILLNDEQERMESKRESTIGMIIAVFGLISIVGASLQIVDYLLNGDRIVWISFFASSACAILFVIILIFVFFVKNRRRKDI